MYITASKLYNYLQCPHRVWRDIYGPKEEKMETNEFVKMLWEKGVLHEKETIKSLGSFVDLSEGEIGERFDKTITEMKKGAKLIYQGVIQHGSLRGIPDLLIKNDDETYTPMDIKSGRGYEGVDEENGKDEEKLKKHYAVQLCLYLEILQKLGFSKNNTGYIFDIDSKKVVYQVNKPMGVRTKKTYIEKYDETKQEVWELINNEKKNKPALSSRCKLCHWYKSCKKWCKENKDLTNIFSVGFNTRNTINKDLGIDKEEQILDINIEEIIKIKKVNKGFLHRIAENGLIKMKRRAEVNLKIKKPVIYQHLDLPETSYEVFFDIEDDPTQAFVYLHGVYERTKKGERFIPFLAKEFSRKSEEKAWVEFWKYILSLPKDDFSFYYYSKHEETIFKKLHEQYPDVITKEKIDFLFNNKNSIDLYYDIVLKNTDWPLDSYSLKDIATYLGFKWRDESPSGALSIQWYNEYLKTKNEESLNRILKYNEDDCKATMVLKDFLVKNNHA